MLRAVAVALLLRALLVVSLFLGFVFTIPAANYFVANVGQCSGVGPCLIPFFGLMIPSGAPIIGLALVLRDFVHRAGGRSAAFFAIGIGAVVSAFLSPPALAAAAIGAFLASETVDLLVYERLSRWTLAGAVLVSGIVGAVLDSLIFLSIAFGSIAFLGEQVSGKILASVAAAAAIAAFRLFRETSSDAA